MNPIKKYLPQPFKLFLHLSMEFFSDIFSGYHFQYAKTRQHNLDSRFQITLKQSIKESPFWENKVKNIRLGAERIEGIEIRPKEIFSFWKAVKAPNRSNGFLKGRNLVNGKLVNDYGGGLCQLSGILYHLALIGHLKIKERFNHSIDIYQDDERFTPIGADATVVYGYKDLKIENPYSFPVYFTFEITNTVLACTLHSNQKIKRQELSFEKIKDHPFIEVLTKSKTEKGWATIANSTYAHPVHF